MEHDGRFTSGDKPTPSRHNRSRSTPQLHASAPGRFGTSPFNAPAARGRSSSWTPPNLTHSQQILSPKYSSEALPQTGEMYCFLAGSGRSDKIFFAPCRLCVRSARSPLARVARSLFDRQDGHVKVKTHASQSRQARQETSPVGDLGRIRDANDRFGIAANLTPSRLNRSRLNATSH